jgi:hypothetical protein
MLVEARVLRRNSTACPEQSASRKCEAILLYDCHRLDEHTKTGDLAKCLVKALESHTLA